MIYDICIVRQPLTVPCPFCGQLNRIELGRLTGGPGMARRAELEALVEAA